MSGGGQSWGLYRNREGHPLPEQTDRLDWKHYPPPTYLAGSKYANKTRMTSQCSDSIGQVLLYLSDFQDVSLELFKWMKTWQGTMNDPSPENSTRRSHHSTRTADMLSMHLAILTQKYFLAFPYVYILSFTSYTNRTRTKAILWFPICTSLWCLLKRRRALQLNEVLSYWYHFTWQIK